MLLQNLNSKPVADAWVHNRKMIIVQGSLTKIKTRQQYAVHATDRFDFVNALRKGSEIYLRQIMKMNTKDSKWRHFS